MSFRNNRTQKMWSSYEDFTILTLRVAEGFAYKTIFGGSNGSHYRITPLLQYCSHAHDSSKPPLLFTLPPLANVPWSIQRSRSKHFSSVFLPWFLLLNTKKKWWLYKCNLSLLNTSLAVYVKVASPKRRRGNELRTSCMERNVMQAGRS
jgi:hypothetical protein